MYTDGNFDDDYFKGTDESNKFRQEYEMRKMKQVNFLLTKLMFFLCSIFCFHWIWELSPNQTCIWEWYSAGWRFGYYWWRTGNPEKHGSWHEWGFELCFFSSYTMIMCAVLNCCDHQELDRQVPLMDEMDDKVGSLASIVFSLKHCLSNA